MLYELLNPELVQQYRLRPSHWHWHHWSHNSLTCKLLLYSLLRPWFMRPRPRPRQEPVRPRPQTLASRPGWPRGLNIHVGNKTKMSRPRPRPDVQDQDQDRHRSETMSIVYVNTTQPTDNCCLSSRYRGTWSRCSTALRQHAARLSSVIVARHSTCERHGLSAVLPPKLLLLCRILVATLISCTVRELSLCVIFPHMKFITSPYQNIFPFHNLVCYDIVAPSFWFPISANLARSMSYPVLSPASVSTLFH